MEEVSDWLETNLSQKSTLQDSKLSYTVCQMDSVGLYQAASISCDHNLSRSHIKK